MKKILILDDDLDILQVVEDLLIYENFEVTGTTRGHELLPLIGSFEPDLVILDYRLADGNGGDLCRAVKAHPVFKQLPVILFSAYVKPGLNLLDFGCDEVIAKPFNIDDLLDSVKRLTGLSDMRTSLAS